MTHDQATITDMIDRLAEVLEKLELYSAATRTFQLAVTSLEVEVDGLDLVAQSIDARLDKLEARVGLSTPRHQSGPALFGKQVKLLELPEPESSQARA